MKELRLANRRAGEKQDRPSKQLEWTNEWPCEWNLMPLDLEFVYAESHSAMSIIFYSPTDS